MTVTIIGHAQLPKPLILTLGNLKGGVGKTTSAYFLAAYFAIDHRLRVLVIDADPLSQTGYSWFKRLRDGGVEVPFVVMPFPSVHIDDCINENRHHYDVIIVDAGGESADIFKAAVLESDEVILMAGATYSDMNRIPSTFRAAREATMDLPKEVGVRILMTKCPVTIKKGKNVSSEYLKHRKRAEESDYEVIGQYISNVMWYRECADAPVGDGADNPLQDRGEYKQVGDEIVSSYDPTFEEAEEVTA